MTLLRVLWWLLVPTAQAAIHFLAFGWLYQLVCGATDDGALLWGGFTLYWVASVGLMALAHVYLLRKAGQWASVWYMSALASVAAGLWAVAATAVVPGDVFAALFACGCLLVALVYAQIYVYATRPKAD
ncbi:MAG: hypothetical protein GC134_05380 [Proteobacteria bacterium]|nr:hypothetical protein [Pseudomonadota bacterium]